MNPLMVNRSFCRRDHLDLSAAGVPIRSMPARPSELAALGDPELPIPNYVAIADRRDRGHGPGFLGSQHQPLFVHDPRKGVENLKSLVDTGQLGNRMGILDEIEQGFARDFKSSISQD